MASSSLTAIDMERNPGKFSSLYEKGMLLGAGISGEVFEGIRRSDGQEVAIKIIPYSHDNDYMKIPGHDEPLLREVAINQLLHKLVKCPNIVQMLDWFLEDRTHILIMEYPHPCKTLGGFLRSRGGRLKETDARHIMRQAVNAAKHCIDHNITHGDLHEENVLIRTETLELKFIDFGLARLLPDAPSNVQTEAVIYMVNYLCRLLFLLMTGKALDRFCGPDLLEYPMIKALCLSKECLDLMIRCKLPVAADRPTLEEFLDHEWFKPAPVRPQPALHNPTGQH